MRYIYLLLITFIFASCGNQKIRFVRNHSTKQKVVEINDIPSLKVKSETVFTPEVNKGAPEIESTRTSTTDVSSEESTQEEEINFPEEVFHSFPISVQDSTTISEDESLAIKNEALRAENLGKWSFGLSLLFFVFVIIAIVFLVVAFGPSPTVVNPLYIVLSLLFAAISMASIITSLVLGIKSLRAAYNTRKGRSRAIAGVIISSIIIALMLINFGFSFF